MPERRYYAQKNPLGSVNFAAMRERRRAIVAGAAPINPPDEWFHNPALSGPTPLTVDDDGRVYGHVASWASDHIGLPPGTKPPKSRSNYAFFRTGVLRTASGADVHVGQITVAGGHAPLSADAGAAVKHYDDTAAAVADVAAGEDEHGIWVAGALRPSATVDQVRALRASAPSGDWRPINNALEMVAVCQVNVPGFPIARAALAASGEVLALVAAGAQDLAKQRYASAMGFDPATAAAAFEKLEGRVASLEAHVEREREAVVAALHQKFHGDEPLETDTD